MKRVIPLFPLNTVLFPGALMPLQVFEPRYQSMIQSCLDEGTPFGIALIENGPEVGGVAQPHLIGCIADIEKVKPLGGGKMDLLVRGGDRFQVVREIQKEPYWKAEVEILPDPEGEPYMLSKSGEALREELGHYANLFMMITNKQLEFERRFEDLLTLSWFVADLLQGDNADKQKLLQAETTAARLEMEVDLLEREIERLKALWKKYKFSEN